MNIAEWLRRSAEAGPGRAALFLGTEAVADYREFARRAGAVAAWLEGQGIGPGDRCAIFMANAPDYLSCLFGIWYAGAAAVPINAKLHESEARWIIGDAGARVTFAAGSRAEALRAAGVDGVVDCTGPGFGALLDTPPRPAPAERAPDDLAWLFYTSGTTGRPKGVIITHRMLLAMSLSYLADVDAVRPGDAALYAAPMSHGAGLYAMLHVRAGARHVCPVSGGFDAGEVFELARHHRDVHMFAAPTMVKRLSAEARASGAGGEGLRTVVYAGGPMYNADIIEAVELFGPVFVQIYGQGESPMCITALPREIVADRTSPGWEGRLASVGRAQSVVELRIADASGTDAAPGEAGEILVRGETVMPGYWQNEAASAEALAGGWLHTGDIGSLDAEGFLTLRDRSKDVIISGGSNVYPREVEEVLVSHPGIAEVSVVGAPHDEWGEEIVAFVVAAPGSAPDPDEWDAHCLAHIARFKRPRRYVPLEALPKNNYGKVLKTELRRRLAEPEG